MIRSALTLFLLVQLAPAYGAEQYSRESSKGFFSVGAGYGMGAVRLLNSDSSYAEYKANGYHLDLDILLWDSGAGDIRLFISHAEMSGNSSTDSSNTLGLSETTAGIKFFTGSHFYLAGGLGNGSVKLTSDSDSATLSFQMVKALLGFEVQLSESFFAGLEFSYRSAPIKKSGNSSLSENSYIEGMAAGLRLIWSPPSVTFAPSSK